MPSFITASTASGVATPSITTYAASLISGISTRFETNPGASFTATGVFPSFFASSIVGLQRANYFHQHHHRHRVHEVHAHKPIGPFRHRRQRGHRDRRRVARQNHFRPQQPVGLGQHRPLDLDFFRHRFHRKIRRRNGTHIGHGLQPRQHRRLLRLGQLPFLRLTVQVLPDRLHSSLQKALLDIAQYHLVTRARKHVSDPVAHRPRAQHCHRPDRFNRHASTLRHLAARSRDTEEDAAHDSSRRRTLRNPPQARYLNVSFRSSTLSLRVGASKTQRPSGRPLLDHELYSSRDYSVSDSIRTSGVSA